MRPLLLALLSLLAASAGAAAPPPAPDGLALFTNHCAGCHGDDGRARTRPGKKYSIPDFTEEGWSRDWPLAKVQHMVAEGVPEKMPGLKDKLTAAEIQAVSAWVLALAGPPQAQPAPLR